MTKLIDSVAGLGRVTRWKFRLTRDLTEQHKLCMEIILDALHKQQTWGKLLGSILGKLNHLEIFLSGIWMQST